MMEMQYGQEMAVEAAKRAEYIWNRDPHFDPFATIHEKA